MYPVYRSRERDAKSYQREMVGDTLSLISEKVIYVNGFTVCHRRRKKKGIEENVIEYVMDNIIFNCDR